MINYDNSVHNRFFNMRPSWESLQSFHAANIAPQLPMPHWRIAEIPTYACICLSAIAATRSLRWIAIDQRRAQHRRWPRVNTTPTLPHPSPQFTCARAGDCWWPATHQHDSFNARARVTTFSRVWWFCQGGNISRCSFASNFDCKSQNI